MEEHRKAVEESELAEKGRDKSPVNEAVGLMGGGRGGVQGRGGTYHQDFSCQMVLKGGLLSVVLWRER